MSVVCLEKFRKDRDFNLAQERLSKNPPRIIGTYEIELLGTNVTIETSYDIPRGCIWVDGKLLRIDEEDERVLVD